MSFLQALGSGQGPTHVEGGAGGTHGAEGWRSRGPRDERDAAGGARRGGKAEAAGGKPKRRVPASGPAASARLKGQAVASASSSVKLRVLLGSTGMPGPIVVVKVTFFTYRPLAAAGLSLITSSRAAA
jgi:hypothetical protein